MTTIFEVLHKRAEPYKITLTRGQKGSYGWEITVVTASSEAALARLQLADAELRKVFGAEQEAQHGA